MTTRLIFLALFCFASLSFGQSEVVRVERAIPQDLRLYLRNGADQNLLREADQQLRQARGGNSSGGGHFVRLRPGAPLLLVDFLKLQTEVRPGPDLPAAGQITPLEASYLTGYARVSMSEQPAFRYLQSRLRLWQNQAPFTTEMILQAARTMTWSYTPHGIRPDLRIPISAELRARWPELKLVPAVLYTTHYGAWISLPIWNEELDLVNQAGLLLHESLRHVENGFGLKIGEANLQKITAVFMLRDPREISFDPDLNIFNSVARGLPSRLRENQERLRDSKRELCRILPPRSAQGHRRPLSPEVFKKRVCEALAVQPMDPLRGRSAICSSNEPFTTLDLQMLMTFAEFGSAMRSASISPGTTPAQVREIRNFVQTYNALEPLLKGPQMDSLSNGQRAAASAELCQKELAPVDELRTLTKLRVLSPPAAVRTALDKRSRLISTRVHLTLEMRDFAIRSVTRQVQDGTDTIHLVMLEHAFARAGVAPQTLARMIERLADAAERGEVLDELRILFRGQSSETLQLLLPKLIAATEHTLRLRDYRKYVVISKR